MTYSKKVKMPLVLLFLLCLFPLGISAQSTVKGIVNDETGQPIIGVTVRVVGTKDGSHNIVGFLTIPLKRTVA